jgi:hypothetical protein
MAKLITYIRLFIEDYPKTPKGRGIPARILYAHLTAAGWN